MTMHYYQGRRQVRAGGGSAGGNRLSYRPDAVPGYTGHTPANKCLPVEVHTRVSQRDPLAPPANASDRQAAVAEEATAAAGTTTYAATYKIDPLHDWSVDPRVRRQPSASTSAPQPPTDGEQRSQHLSTYQAHILNHSRGEASGSASAPTSPAAGRQTLLPTVRPGYLTTSAASQLPVAEKFATAVSLSAGNSPRVGSSATGSPGSTWQSQRPAACSFPGPAEGLGGRPSSTASSVPWATQSVGSPPSRRGLWAASPAGPGAAPGSSPTRQPPPKEAVLLHSLDQHPRGRLPGYTGHRPQHAVSLDLPPPTTLTTWGAASQQALRAPPLPADCVSPTRGGGAAGGGGRKGILGFFSAGSGSEFVSENGLAEAARFHELVRPLEGQLKIPHPPSTNRHGAKFTG